MMTVDTDTCAFLLRAATDQIAASIDRPSSTDDIASVIDWVRSRSARAAADLRSQLATRYPDIGWTGEKDMPDDPNAAYWVYDPIDGAYHFLQGLPLWSSSLALVVGGRCIFGIVYDPTSNELFIAREGQGVTLNGERVTTRNKTDLKGAVLGSAVPPIAHVGPEEHAVALQLLERVTGQVFVVRQMASASLQLAYVAVGRLDGYFEVGHDIPDWLTGALLVKEAAGVVTDLSGNGFGWSSDGLLAASPDIHAQLLKVAASAAHVPSA